MKLLARVVTSATMPRWCQLVPYGRSFEITTRPRLPVGELITVALPGCPALDDDAIAAWLAHAYRERDVRVLRPTSFRPAVLADFLDALNAELHIGGAPECSADAVAAFARTSGGALLAEIRGELAHGLRPAVVLERVRRFAMIVAGDGAAGVLAELAALHDVDRRGVPPAGSAPGWERGSIDGRGVPPAGSAPGWERGSIEHLLGLEHAVARWIAGAASPRAVELGVLARQLPADDASAGISPAWFAWWWRLARACTRVDLMTIVDRAVELADERCVAGRRAPVADDARAEARRMASRMRDARRAVLWSEPPGRASRPVPRVHDEDDAHDAAFMAVSHAAHAIAHALGGQLTAAAANRAAMQTVAELAVRFLLDDPGA